MLLPQPQEAAATSDKSDEESDTEEESESEGTPTVVDYDSYARVCEDYRKTSAALKERESEVAELIKENEAKGLTIKLLRDQLQSAGSVPSNSSAATDDVKQLHAMIDQQKQVIQSLLGIDSSKSDIEKVLKPRLCSFPALLSLRSENTGTQRGSPQNRSVAGLFRSLVSL